MQKRFFEAVATLTGTTIGAGVLGIPYVAAKAGLAAGLLHIIIIGAAMMLVNLMLGEIALRTKGNHQLTGYAGRLLGKTGKRLMTATMVAGIYGALLAYIIGVGMSISSMLPFISQTAGSMAFVAAGSLIVYFGLKAVEKSELFLSFLAITIMIALVAAATSSDRFSQGNFTPVDPKNIFLPYGVVLFAFLGAVAVPEMKEELGGRGRKLLRMAIITGGLIPIVLYSLFTIAIVGTSGTSTQQVATQGIGEALGGTAAILANLFAVLVMSTSFIALGLALKEMYMYDYGLGKKSAWILTCALPIMAFLLGARNFIATLGIAGAVAGGVEGALLAVMHLKARKMRWQKPEYRISCPRIANAILAAMFVAGIAYTLISVTGGR